MSRHKACSMEGKGGATVFPPTRGLGGEGAAWELGEGDGQMQGVSGVCNELSQQMLQFPTPPGLTELLWGGGTEFRALPSQPGQSQGVLGLQVLAASPKLAGPARWQGLQGLLP